VADQQTTTAPPQTARPDRLPAYVETAVAAVTRELDAGCDPALVRLYTLLALTKGAATTLENVHDAWALWRMETHPDHPSIIPFPELSPEVQELDREYTEAIHRAAKAHQWATGQPSPGVPPLPEGVYGRIELPGYRRHTGWVAEETRFGVQVAVIRNLNGQVIAEVVPGPGVQFIHLTLPSAHPDPVITVAALPAGGGFDGDPDDTERPF
jgi:hypothetical protein